LKQQGVDGAGLVLGYRKNSMNVKIAMLVPASEYERFTLDAASSSPMEYLRGRHHHPIGRAFYLSYDRTD
jgi:hypothetical protein